MTMQSDLAGTGMTVIIKVTTGQSFRAGCTQFRATIRIIFVVVVGLLFGEDKERNLLLPLTILGSYAEESCLMDADEMPGEVRCEESGGARQNTTNIIA